MGRMFCYFFTCFVFFLAASCTSPSLQEYRKKAENASRFFQEELSYIQTREELVARLPKIQQYYEEIVDLLIEVHRFEKKQGEDFIQAADERDFLASEALMIEIERIYQLEGGKELMEKAQKEALFRLDAALMKQSF